FQALEVARQPGLVALDDDDPAGAVTVDLSENAREQGHCRSSFQNGFLVPNNRDRGFTGKLRKRALSLTRKNAKNPFSSRPDQTRPLDRDCYPEPPYNWLCLWL